MKNFLRAAIGQGLGMGWGDEAEARIRSLLSDQDYEDLLSEIRGEYGSYAEENPLAAGLAEFGGGAIPGVVMMLLPGAQAAGAAQLSRGALGAVAKMMGAGAMTGAVSGAGSAENDRTAGALSGALIGGAIGGTIPAVTRGVGSGSSWLRERLLPSQAGIENSALTKLNRALLESEMEPRDLLRVMGEDARLGVPTMVANAGYGPASLAEAVAQRGGSGSRRLDQALNEQKLGSRERTHQQITRGLQPGDYYRDEERLMDELRGRAKTMYDQAYAVGEIDDPRIMEVLDNPQFQKFFLKAREIANAEASAARLRGEDPSKYQLREIFQGTGQFDADGNEIMKRVAIPDVRTLDYIKRGIDTVIDRGFDGQGISKAEASAIRELRREFINAIDQNAPAYKQARAAYAGDMEIMDAMRAGMNDFNKMDHEEVKRLIEKMSPAEKDAFRTGVSRYLYSRIMDPSQNINAAQRIIGAPEMQAKLKPLFESEAKYNLFKAALERESQIFHQANRILGGSPTSRREAMREILESDAGIGDAMRDIITGGWWNSVTNGIGRFIRSTAVTDETADRLSKMLTSKDPDEVAAVVQLLEDHLSSLGPRALKAGATEAGLTTGSVASSWPSPLPDQEE